MLYIHIYVLLYYRWGSLIFCFRSVHDNKHALQALAISEEAQDAGLKQSIKKLLLSEAFWEKLKGYIDLLEPIADAINWSEGDSVHFSIVARTFHTLEKTFEEGVANSPVLKKEEEAVKKIITQRKSFLMLGIHFAANLLDPRFKGQHLSTLEIVSL